MRSTEVIGVVLCFSLAFAMMTAVGIPGAGNIDSQGGDAAVKTLGDLGDQADPQTQNENSPFDWDVAGDNEPSTVGGVIASGDFFIALTTGVALLPIILMDLGFPNYFAVPIGSLAQIIVGIGFLQFTLGRKFL